MTHHTTHHVRQVLPRQRAGETVAAESADDHLCFDVWCHTRMWDNEDTDGEAVEHTVLRGID